MEDADMSRELHRLTDLAVNEFQPESDATGSKLLADGGGLYLQITQPGGVKSWLFRYTLDRTAKSVGLGPVHTVTLADARNEARRLRKMVLDGRDPKLERMNEKAAHIATRQRTFRVCAEEFIKGLEGVHKSKKAHAQWTSSLERYAYPVIGDVPVAQIDVHMIRKIMTKDDGWAEKTETLSRVRGRIERILGWSTVLGFRKGENPARFSKFLSEVLPSRRSIRPLVHHPALPYQQLPDFMTILRAQPQSISSLALEFLIPTAARTGEVSPALRSAGTPA